MIRSSSLGGGMTEDELILESTRDNFNAICCAFGENEWRFMLHIDKSGGVV